MLFLCVCFVFGHFISALINSHQQSINNSSNNVRKLVLLSRAEHGAVGLAVGDEDQNSWLSFGPSRIADKQAATLELNHVSRERDE